MKSHPLGLSDLTVSERALLVPPRVAIPTIMLAVSVAVGFIGLGVAAASSLVPWPVAVVGQSILAFAAFTPLHDASHESVARRGKLNEAVGWLMGFMLMAPFPAFRLVHLTHHQHTNDPARDPDMWSGSGSPLTWPLRWATQDLYYYVYYARNASRRPRREVAATLFGIVVVLLAAGAIVATGHGRDLLLYWVLPARVAIVLLALAFDFIPHHPHAVLHRVDPMRASAIIERRWLTPLMFGQNYHLVHHLYPGIPFYGYGRAFWALREKLVARGAWIRGLSSG
ncbi:MAG: fatty acid desaturase [Polyangiaceae bacterium]